MRAIVYHSYGAADVLKLEEIEKPVPKDDQVLIKVRAAALNPIDWRMLKGVPFIFRLMMKVRTPTVEQPVGIGRDVAGVIEAVGKSVTQFRVGDEVFGTTGSAVAEYVCAKESALVVKPEALTFEQAASIPVAGLTALQGLRDKGKIQAGQRVLVSGASGGVGTFAVQIAKLFGAEVTGVCSGANVGMVRSIGADAVIDYTKVNFSEGAERYDIILQCAGDKSFSDCRGVLTPNGRFVMIGGPHDVKMIEVLTEVIKAIVISLFARQKAVTFIAKSSQRDLAFLAEMIATGKMTPVIDRVCKLDETPEAVRYLEEGHARGKVVIAIAG